MNRPHPHPLLFQEEREFNGDHVVIVCSRCRQPLCPPAFSCSDSACNFHIHLSCLHLPPQILTPFHLHRLDQVLGFTTDINGCYICGQTPFCDDKYICNKCSKFEMDIKCAITDPKSSGLCHTGGQKYQHFSHPHPLTLFTLPLDQQQQDNRVLACVVCKHLIQSNDDDNDGDTSTYFCCSQCDDTHFHKKCAELPRELPLNLACHHHPLFLLIIKITPYSNDDDDVVCTSCRSPCRGFVYTCPSCKFFLHAACLRTFNHKHAFAMLRNEQEFRCRFCGKNSENEYPWFCNICYMLAHKKCVEFPLKLMTTVHSGHELTFYYIPHSDNNEKILCEICGDIMRAEYAGYVCSECNYFTHLACAESQRLAPQSTRNDDYKSGAAENEIQHFSHPHDLTLTFPASKEDTVCDGCMKCLSVSAPSYGCLRCGFFLHKTCVELPTNAQSPLHPHSLTLISIPGFVFQCNACFQHFHGFAYHCRTCLATFDLACTFIKIPLQHPNHQHPLFLCPTDRSFQLDYRCHACQTWACAAEEVAFRCVLCDYYLHLRCAMMPVIVRYRFDPHPLNLTFVEEERVDEYYCDICEEERDPWLWFYSCGKCSFTAHSKCVLGEFPYVKSAMHKSHRHPLNLVMKAGKIEGDRCGACNKSCADSFAFECGACKFNVHATGRCYDLQVQEGNLAFTNRNVFSRANQPYEQPQK